MNSFESNRENTRIHAMTDDHFAQWMLNQMQAYDDEKRLEIGG